MVGDARATKRVRDDDFGFRADAHARARVEFGGVDFEGLARVGSVLPCGNKVAVGFAHGRNKGAAARVQAGEGLVKGFRVECYEKAVDGRELVFDDGRRRVVVVPLGKGFSPAKVLSPEVCALRVALLGNDVVLVA